MTKNTANKEVTEVSALDSVDASAQNTETAAQNAKGERVPLPKYSLSEELISAITHGIGALLAVAGLVLMLIKADGTLETVCAALFGASMICLYTVSCVYHALKRNKGKKVLRVLDHCFIYPLIIGTYIPYCLISLQGRGGIFLLALNLIVGALGITLTAVDIRKYAKFGMVCYIAMGWIIVTASVKLLSVLPKEAFALLLIGGIIYTVGAIIYGIGSKKKYFHSIWHFFVLGGTILHFFSIYLYVI